MDLDEEYELDLTVKSYADLVNKFDEDYDEEMVVDAVSAGVITETTGIRILVKEFGIDKTEAAAMLGAFVEDDPLPTYKDEDE